jgi:hypothetical protein
MHRYPMRRFVTFLFFKSRYKLMPALLDEGKIGRILRLSIAALEEAVLFHTIVSSSGIGNDFLVSRALSAICIGVSSSVVHPDPAGSEIICK